MGTTSPMSERPAPDLNHVREALRRHDDRRQDTEADADREAAPPEPRPEERDPESE